jgi:hypothetical protein
MRMRSNVAQSQGWLGAGMNGVVASEPPSSLFEGMALAMIFSGILWIPLFAAIMLNV